MPSSHKKRIGLAVISRQQTVTSLAKENNTSRKFIRQQGKQLQTAIDNFSIKAKPLIVILPC